MADSDSGDEVFELEPDSDNAPWGESNGSASDEVIELEEHENSAPQRESNGSDTDEVIELDGDDEEYEVLKSDSEGSSAFSTSNSLENEGDDTCEDAPEVELLTDADSRSNAQIEMVKEVQAIDSDLLKQCMDYCSHAWPSEDGYDMLLSKLLPDVQSLPEPNPADLSTLAFSDSGESEPEAAVPIGQVGLDPSALNPSLKSKQAKNVHMQRLLHKEAEKKRQEHSLDGNADVKKQQTDLLEPLLTDLGWSSQDIQMLVERCNHDTKEIQKEVDSIIASAATSESTSWFTSVKRRHQREAGLKQLKKQEMGHLKNNFGRVMRELEAPSGKKERESTEQVEPLPRKEEPMPEVSSVQQMNRSECRRLLQQMKPLLHAPAALYKALAKRALDEYCKAKPLCFFDCRRITFWQFNGDEGRHRSGRYAGTRFFEYLLESEAGLLARLSAIHPIAAVYMLHTMMESQNVITPVFQEVGRYVGERISNLDRDALGRLPLIFAKAGVRNPGLLIVVKQECLRRCKLKEGPHSLSPKVITDVLLAFAITKTVDEELFEAMMLRAVSLLDTALLPELPAELCAPVISSFGKVPAAPFLLQDLVQLCRSFLDLQCVDQQFFDDVSDYIVRALRLPDAETIDWFIRNPSSTLPQIAQIYVKAQIFSSDLFAALKWIASRRKEDLRADSLKQLQNSFQAQKREEEKQERKRHQPPRRRGAMGRALVEHVPEVRVQTRKEKARDLRQRLAAMTEEEVLKEVAEAEELAGYSASAKVLLSGIKMEALLEAQEGPK
ncbi:unnamed protein product, partial [Effrenium voratum]